MYLFVILFVFCIPFSFAITLLGKYEHAETIIENSCQFHWSINSNTREIQFGVTVKSLGGWVAIGFSDKGTMKGMDTILVDARGDVSDLFSTDFKQPEPDFIQNYILVGRESNQTHTFVEMKRQLVTCDTEYDVELSLTPIFVSCAFGESTTLKYHGSNRGSKLISLFIREWIKPKPILPNSLERQYSVNSPNQTLPVDNITFYWDVTNNRHQYMIPTIQSTVYTCFKMNASSQLTNQTSFYVSSYEIIPNPLAHHIHLVSCPPQAFQDHPDIIDDCYMVPNDCSYVLSWGVGTDYIALPDDVSLLMNHRNSYMMLLVHYENPSLLPAMSGNLGFRLTMTSLPSVYQSGLLYVSTTHHGIQVPAQSIGRSETQCPSTCLSQTIPPEGVRVILAIAHGHLIMKRMIVRHIRDDQEIARILDTNYFDFNKQTMKHTNVVLLPKDRIVVQCEFDGTKRSTPTLGGLRSVDEMCDAVLVFYPSIQEATRFCGSLNETHAYCGSNYGGFKKEVYISEDNKVPISKLGWIPLDLKQDKCYVGMIEGFESPFSTENVNIAYSILILLVVIVHILVHLFLPSRYDVKNTASHCIMMILITLSLLLNIACIPALMDAKNLMRMDDHGKMYSSSIVSILATNGKLVIISVMYELLVRRKVNVILLLHHLVTVLFILSVSSMFYQSFNVDMFRLAIVYLFYINTEQPIYLGLIRKPFVTNWKWEIRACIIYAACQKTGIFIGSLVILTSTADKDPFGFNFLPQKEETNRIYKPLFLVISVVLYLVQLYIVRILYVIAHKGTQVSDAKRELIVV